MSAVLAALSLQSCPCSHVLTILFCPFPVLGVPFWLFRLTVLFWLSFSGYPLCSVLSWLSYPSSLVFVLAVLPLYSYHGSFVLPVPIWLSCSDYPLLAVLFFLSLSWLSYRSRPILAALSWQPSLDRSFLTVLS